MTCMKFQISTVDRHRTGLGKHNKENHHGIRSFVRRVWRTRVVECSQNGFRSPNLAMPSAVVPQIRGRFAEHRKHMLPIENTTTAAEPMRRALCPVARYNERVNRARSSNKNLSTNKLKEVSSPGPRASSRKERPPKEGLASTRRMSGAGGENKGQVAPPKLPPKRSLEPSFGGHSMSEGIKSNPFLLADQKKVATVPDKKDIEKWVRSTPTKGVPPLRLSSALAEPRPIGPLSDEQRVSVQRKRESILMEKRRESVLLEQPLEAEEQMATGEAPEETRDEKAYTDEALTEWVLPMDDWEELEWGVPIAPAPPPSAASPIDALCEPSLEPPPPSSEEASSAMATQLMLAPLAAVPAPKTTRRPRGDLACLKTTASSELLAALAGMLPVLDGALRTAEAVERTAMPLAELVRQQKRRR